MPSGWQQSLTLAIRDPVQLCDQLGLDANYRQGAIRAAREFPLLVPREYLNRIQPGDPDDPLLRQILPLSEELDEVPGFLPDPVGDQDAMTGPGLLQKYSQRALIVTTGKCAVHCRYCFRRHFPYRTTLNDPQRWRLMLQKLKQDQSIVECILSGGDPLMFDDRQLERHISQIAAMEPIRRLRIHTRLPVMIPSRVTDHLLALLGNSRLTTIVVIQVNHPAELDAPTRAALSRFVDSGILLLNQSVLLRGVNDRWEVLRDLCTQLIDLRIMPYYLHQLDRVAGAAHFEVPIASGRALIRRLRGCLPGYAVPRYVQDQPGQTSKKVLA